MISFRLGLFLKVCIENSKYQVFLKSYSDHQDCVTSIEVDFKSTNQILESRNQLLDS